MCVKLLDVTIFYIYFKLFFVFVEKSLTPYYFLIFRDVRPAKGLRHAISHRCLGTLRYPPGHRSVGHLRGHRLFYLPIDAYRDQVRYGKSGIDHLPHSPVLAISSSHHLVYFGRQLLHVERLLEIGLRDNARDIGLPRSLCQGDNTDAVSSQRAEEFTRDAGHALHVLPHDGDRCQVVLHHDLVDAAHGDLVGKLRGEHLLG